MKTDQALFMCRLVLLLLGFLLEFKCMSRLFQSVSAKTIIRLGEKQEIPRKKHLTICKYLSCPVIM